jgi:methylated-DNA-[protein]-cysteine S-methyltransferase
MMEEVYFASCPSPIGTIWVASDKEGVCLLSFGVNEDRFLEQLSEAGFRQPRPDWAVNRGVLKEIQDYFEGKLDCFTSALHARGNPFEMRVWEVLQRIPLGETRSYEEIACAVGSPRACRAVGGANSRNPIPLLIPCHRVIRKDGRLGGFSSGTGIKHWLLQFEQQVTHS